jgi:hypothetical protein
MTDIFYLVNLVVLLPALVMITRPLILSIIRPPWPPGAFHALAPRVYFVQDLPNDLAIIGMTLGFASYALISPTESGLKTAFLILPYFPFVLMTIIAIFQSAPIRFTLGLIAYFTGAGAFLAAALKI